MAELSYPPPPWRLVGTGLVNVQLIPASTLELPAGLRAISPWPGRAVGGVYVGRYEPGSTLEYSELLGFAMAIGPAGRMGAWVTRIYVDSPESRAGGREIWGLPKELAEFEWHDDQVQVRQGGALVIQAGFPPEGAELRLRSRLPAFGVKDGRILHFIGNARARIGLSNVVWDIPPDSPLAGLGGGWSFRLDDLAVSVPAPTILRAG